MGFIDELITLFFQLTSQFTKPRNETSSLIDLIGSIMWIQFLNLGFILIFVSLKIDVPLLKLIGIFDGQYSGFNSPWYKEFGETIVLMMLT